MGKHQSYVDIVRRIASNNWGRECDSPREAERQFAVQADLTSIGILELVRIANVVVKAIAKAEAASVSGDPESGKRPEYAVRIPGIEIGDRLYCEDLCDGISERLVVSVTPDGYARAVIAGVERFNEYSFEWASDSHHRTLKEAVIASAKEDIDYHGKRAEYAREALRAAEAGEDLSRYLEPMPE